MRNFDLKCKKCGYNLTSDDILTYGEAFLYPDESLCDLKIRCPKCGNSESMSE